MTETSFVELHEDDVFKAVLALFPDATLAADEDAQLVINTGVMWSGHVGDQLLGHMNIPGENLLHVKDIN